VVKSIENDSSVKDQIPDREEMIGFLLGALPEDEREEIEIRLFDEDVFDEYLSLEIEVIENYLRGKLSSEDTRLFETNYLTTRRGREQVEAVKAFASYVDKLPTRPASAAVPTRASSTRQPLPAHWAGQTPSAPKYWVRGMTVVVALLLIATSYSVVSVWQQHQLLNEARSTQQTIEAKKEFELQKLRESNELLKVEINEQKAEQEHLRTQIIDEQRRFQEQLSRAQRGLTRNQDRQAQDRQTQDRQTQDSFSAEYDLEFASDARGTRGLKPLSLSGKAETVNFRLHFPLQRLKTVSGIKIQLVGAAVIWETSEPERPKRAGKHRVLTVKNVPSQIFTTGDYVLTLSGNDNQGNPSSLDFTFSLEKTTSSSPPI
jgi:hypothetical protein